MKPRSETPNGKPKATPTAAQKPGGGRPRLSTKKKILVGAVAVLFLAAVTLPILYFAGVFNRPGGPGLNYKRPVILRQLSLPAPQTLSDLLNRNEASVESLLDHPALEAELLAAETLTDVVDSRLSLRNLRQIRETGLALDATLAARDRKTGPVPVAARPPDQTRARLSAIESKLAVLLAPAELAIGLVQSRTDFKAVWTKPDEVRLRWSPHGEWIPEEGYRLVRIVNGEETVVAEQLGALRKIRDLVADNRKGEEGAELVAAVQSLFEEANLTPDKLSVIGVADSAAFDSLVYGKGVENVSRARVSAEKDFAWSRDLLLTVAGSPEEKVPLEDALQRLSVRFAEALSPDVFSMTDIRTGILSALSLRPLSVALPYAEPTAEEGGTGGGTGGEEDLVFLTPRDQAMYAVLEARKTIVGRAFVDAEFAAATGLGHDDDLSSLRLPDGTQVDYRLSVPSGRSWTVSVTKGEEQAVATPGGLQGYGVDNLVSLRWQAPEAAFDRSVISGYYIERKGPDGGAFQRLNAIPVAISYSLDETGVFFEAPVFYQDDGLANGQSATYRIQALDIFGRLSAPSDEIEVSVYKVTPPDPPNLGQATLSREADRQKEAFYRTLANLNGNGDGIIVPVVRTSSDTIGLVVYRAEALGAGTFGPPEEIGRVPVESEPSAAVRERSIRVGKAMALLSPVSEGKVDLALFDGDVKPGSFYKYWAAAVDDWGNESAWSASRIQGVPLGDLPAAPAAPLVSLTRNTLPDLSLVPPGFGTTLTGVRTFQATTRKLLESLQAPGGTPAGPVIRIVPGSEKAVDALAGGISLGTAVSDLSAATLAPIPQRVSASFGNLPDPDRIHAVAAFGQDDLLPDGSAVVAWMHYSGEGLAGYHVYRALVDGETPESLLATSREEIVQKGAWSLVQSNLKDNRFVDGPLERQEGRIYLYLVCLVPEKPAGSLLADALAEGAAGLQGFGGFAPGGWIQLSWERPADPQVSAFRVYRSEVPFFQEGQDLSALGWSLVADGLDYTSFTEKVDQTYAHYYYYKVTSISVWGQESAGTAVSAFRVPATSPPQTPAMLLPLPKKGKIQVNWAGVPHASAYLVYRTTLPKIAEADILDLQLQQPDLYASVFQVPSEDDLFLSGKLLVPKLRPIIPGSDTPVLSTDKFNTLQQVSPTRILASVRQVSARDKLEAFRTIADTYGPLALTPYGRLSEAAAKLILWEKVAEVAIEPGQDSTGMFSYTDEAVVFGSTYLYTVQAKNDDELYSGRPMPESSSPRKAQPFEPVTGLSGAIVEGKPKLSWNQARDPGLTWQESREYVAGYLVYRSTQEDGFYHQASPLLSDLSWRDESADPYAYNWYKIKVVDTGGYLSDFSAPVLVRGTPPFLFKKGDFILVQPIVPNRSLIIIKPTPIPILLYDKYETLTMGPFTLQDVSLLRTTGARSGSGKLVVGDHLVEVALEGVALRATRIAYGTATLKGPTVIGPAGVHLSALTLKAGDTVARVDGYVTAPTADGEAATRNLMGDLYSIQVANGSLSPEGLLAVTRIPGFRHRNLLFGPVSAGTVSLALEEPAGGRVRLYKGSVEVHLGLETVDNIGLPYTYASVGFDGAGRLTGELALQKTSTLRLVIPAGLGMRVTASRLTYADGAVDPARSLIQGKLILPFRTFEDSLPVTLDPNAFRIRTDIGETAILAGFDRLLPEGSLPSDNSTSFDTVLGSLSLEEKEELDESMLYLGYRIQASSLLVLPTDLAVQETLSTVPFNIQDWSGEGFTLADAAMTPALVGNSEELTGEEIGITPGRVAVDLDRSAPVAGTAPEETKQPFWLGIVVKNGRVSLPSAYITTDDDQRVFFGLTPGELLYDLNGVSYQNLVYSAEGIPANFGDALGGFRDVRVFDCMLDLYGNRVNLEINGDMGIPLFNYQRANVRLFTSKELGTLVCTVAETDKFDPSGTGEVQFRITGGQLQPDGLHMNGTLDLAFPGKMAFQDLAFTDLLVPSDMERMTEAGNPEGLYGKALFDTPLRVSFHDFPMEIRALSFASTKEPMKLALLKPRLAEGASRSLKLAGLPVVSGMSIDIYHTSLTLWGGMQLADTLAMDTTEDFDRVVLADVMSDPAVHYEEARSKLELEFEEFSRVDAVVKPAVASTTDDSIVEFNTDHLELAFKAASALTGGLVEADVRIGYDKAMSRYFFAMGVFYDDPSGGINFAFGRLNQVTGLIGYNLALDRNEAGTFDVPKGKGALFSSIDDLSVDRSPGGNWFLAASANLYLSIGVGEASLPLGEVRDIYLVVEKGPDVEMGGDFYAPVDVLKIIQGKGFTKVGSARIGYYHGERLFQFSLVLDGFPMYGMTVSGDLGFDMSPDYWEVRLGYPEALTASAYGIVDVGFGLAMRDSDVDDGSFIKAKALFNFDTGDISIWPVYVRAYLYAGAEGQYYYDRNLVELEAWLRGGVEGGIKAFGKRYSIIHLMLDANGKLTNGGGDWKLAAHVRIYYSLDLWLDEIEGSVGWNINRTF